MANMHRVLVLSLVVLCLTQHCGACMQPPKGASCPEGCIAAPEGAAVPQKQGEMTPPAGEGADAAADSISDAAADADR